MLEKIGPWHSACGLALVVMTAGGCTEKIARLPVTGPSKDSLIARMESREVASRETESPRVGVVVTIEEYVRGISQAQADLSPRRQADVYSEACDRVMAALESDGIVADLLVDEGDPRLDRDRILFYVTYSEAISHSGTGSQPWDRWFIRPIHRVMVYDSRTRDKTTYFTLEDAVKALHALP